MRKTRTIAPFSVLLFCLSAVALAANPPKVVFIGETASFAQAITRHPNWIDKGISEPGNDSFDVARRFQADVVSLHPAIVHILVGSTDVAAYHDRTVPFFLDQYITDVTTMVNEARAANIKVILGTLPEVLLTIEGPAYPNTPFRSPAVRQINAWLEGFGAANNIPVVNYHDLLCACIGSTDVYDAGQNGAEQYELEDGFSSPAASNNISPEDGAAIGAYAQFAIDTVGLTLKSGYLSNHGSSNTFIGSQQIAFTPVGVWSDGQSRAQLNTNFIGASGTWTSSNPAVMYVDQQGQATALGPGKARISYQSLNGVYFSPWDVTVSTAYCALP